MASVPASLLERIREDSKRKKNASWLMEVATGMKLTDYIWSFLGEKEVLGPFLGASVADKKRNPTIWEAFYMASGIPLPNSPHPLVASRARENMVVATARQLVHKLIYPEVMPEMKNHLHEQYLRAQTKVGYMAGLNAADATIEPVMQLSLDAFKASGTQEGGSSVVSAVDMIKQLLSFSSANAYVNFSFREQMSLDDIIAKANQLVSIVMEKAITGIQIERFDALDTSWYLPEEDYSAPGYEDSSTLIEAIASGEVILMRLTIDVDLLVANEVGLGTLYHSIVDAVAKRKLADLWIVSSPLFYEGPRTRFYLDFLTSENYVVEETHLLLQRNPLMFVEILKRGDESPAWYGMEGGYAMGERSVTLSTILRLFLDPDSLSSREMIPEFLKDINSLSESGVMISSPLISTDEEYETAFSGETNMEELFPPPLMVVDFFTNEADNLKSALLDLFSRAEDTYEKTMKVFWENMFLPNVNGVNISGISNVQRVEILPYKYSNLLREITKISDKRYYVQFDPAVASMNISVGEEATWIGETLLAIDTKKKTSEDEIRLLFEGQESATVNAHGENTKSKPKAIMKMIRGMLADPLIEGYQIDTNDINAIKELFGIEAARNAIIKAVVGRLASGRSYIRHYILFADLVTRSGELSKMTNIGKYEGTSAMGMATIKSPLAIVSSVALAPGQQQYGGDIMTSLTMGQTPRVGTVLRDEFEHAKRMAAANMRAAPQELSLVRQPVSKKSPPVSKKQLFAFKPRPTNA